MLDEPTLIYNNNVGIEIVAKSNGSTMPGQ